MDLTFDSTPNTYVFGKNDVVFVARTNQYITTPASRQLIQIDFTDLPVTVDNSFQWQAVENNILSDIIITFKDASGFNADGKTLPIYDGGIYATALDYYTAIFDYFNNLSSIARLYQLEFFYLGGNAALITLTRLQPGNNNWSSSSTESFVSITIYGASNDVFGSVSKIGWQMQFKKYASDFWTATKDFFAIPNKDNQSIIDIGNEAITVTDTDTPNSLFNMAANDIQFWTSQFTMLRMVAYNVSASGAGMSVVSSTKYVLNGGVASHLTLSDAAQYLHDFKKIITRRNKRSIKRTTFDFISYFATTDSPDVLITIYSDSTGTSDTYGTLVDGLEFPDKVLFRLGAGIANNTWIEARQNEFKTTYGYEAERYELWVRQSGIDSEKTTFIIQPKHYTDKDFIYLNAFGAYEGVTFSGTNNQGLVVDAQKFDIDIIIGSAHIADRGNINVVSNDEFVQFTGLMSLRELQNITDFFASEQIFTKHHLSGDWVAVRIIPDKYEVKRTDDNAFGILFKYEYGLRDESLAIV
jgi:hypothetical protein